MIVGLISLAIYQHDNRIPYKSETIYPKIRIVKITVAKYSRVYGTFEYDGLVYRVSNSSSGYYYKKYNLNEGDSIIKPVILNYYRDSVDVDNLYDDTLTIKASDIDLTDFEKQ